MAYPFTKIVIIYNPNSTGDSKANAQKLKRELAGNLPKNVSLSLVATRDAGHAETIAFKECKKVKRVLIVSSSGDGGYNEVINGVLSSGNRTAATLVLPSGNANDHHEATAERSLKERILDPKIEAIDVIRVNSTKDSKEWIRYAHSYVGIGLTAYVGKKLTQADLNPVNEKWLIVKYLLKFDHVTIRVKGRQKRYSSLVFGNIDRMSKVIKLSQDSKVTDGKFEVYEIRYRSILRVVGVLLLGSTLGLKPDDQCQSYTFRTTKPLEIQCDGEVITLDTESDVTISSENLRLPTIL